MCDGKKDGNNDPMRRAYAVTGKLFRDRLGRERPEAAEELASVRPAEVVAVRGSYDHIHLVLQATGVPFLDLPPRALARADWEQMQVLLINCPGQLPPAAMERIPAWVRGGGYLVTTDWALKHLLEPLFPGRVRHNGQRTADCVVRVELDGETADPLLDGFLEDGRDPLWWLEGSSYPIEVIDTKRIRVLARSREVGEKWGQEPVVVTFDEGRGAVLHLLSHLYLQRSDVRDARDAVPAVTWYQNSLGLSEDEAADYAVMSAGLRAGEVRSSLSQARLVSNVVLDSRRRRRTERGKAS
jgi:hypothetical protein